MLKKHHMSGVVPDLILIGSDLKRLGGDGWGFYACPLPPSRIGFGVTNGHEPTRELEPAVTYEYRAWLHT